MYNALHNYTLLRDSLKSSLRTKNKVIKEMYKGKMITILNIPLKGTSEALYDVYYNNLSIDVVIYNKLDIDDLNKLLDEIMI